MLLLLVSVVALVQKTSESLSLLDLIAAKNSSADCHDRVDNGGKREAVHSNQPRDALIIATFIPFVEKMRDGVVNSFFYGTRFHEIARKMDFPRPTGVLRP